MINSEAKFESTPVIIQVWPSIGLGARNVVESSGKGCQASFELHLGRHFVNGIEAELKLERIPDVRFILMNFPDTPKFKARYNFDTQGEEVVTLTWRTAELLPMRVIPFTVYLENMSEKDKTREEWEMLVNSIQFIHNPAQQEFQQ